MRNFRTRSSRQIANTPFFGGAVLLMLSSGLIAQAEPSSPVPTESREISQETPEPGSDTQTQEMVPRAELDHALSQLDAITHRLVDVYRQLFLRLPEAERSAFLTELINGGPQSNGSGSGTGSEGQPAPRAPLPYQVRELAYDLATAEVVSARPLGSALIDAASLGLNDERPTIRTKAAGLLAKLDASAVLDRVHEALRNETHPQAAAAMLSVLARHPSADALPLALVRLDPRSQPRIVLHAAIDAILAIHNTNPITETETLARMAEAIGTMNPSDLTPNAVRLLARIGEVEAVRSHLTSERAAICRAAAESLVNDAESMEAILDHARQNPVLFEYAAESVRHHEPNATRFALVAVLPAPTPEKRDEMLAKLAAGLPPAELLRVVSTPMDLTERERLLSSFATATELSRFAELEYRTEDRRLLLESLVRTRLQLKNAAGALRVVEGIPDDARWETLREHEIASLLWLNRIDDAVTCTEHIGHPKGPDVWLSTIEKIETLAHAPTVLLTLAQNYSENLTEQQRERLASLQRRIATLHPEPEDETPGLLDEAIASESESPGSGERPETEDLPATDQRTADDRQDLTEERVSTD